MPAITSANVANAIVKLVAADALPALLSNLVMGNLVNRQYEPALAQAGDTINVPIPPTLVANNIAEGGSVQTQNPNLGNAQIVLNTHAEATFQIPDVTKALAVPDLLMVYMRPAIIAIAEKIESDLLGLYGSFTANAPVGAVNTAITEATVDSAETTLFSAKLPAIEPKLLVVNAATYSQLRQIPKFQSWTNTGQQGIDVILQGDLNKIKDFFVFRSQNVLSTGAGGTLNGHNLAFAKDAIGLIIRKLSQPLPGTGAIAEYAELGNFGMRVTMSYQPNTLAQQFTVDVLYGCGPLRNQFAVQVNT
jgi:hypothetical protein